MLARKGSLRHRTFGRVYSLVGMTHGVLMLVFVLLIGGYVAASIVSQARRRQTASVSPS